MSALNDIIKKVQSSNNNEGLSIYFIGIGGIGMSALARYFNSKGVQVSGYDKTETVLTKQLIDEGIRVHYNDVIEEIDKNAAVVIYTPAIPKNHVGYNYCIENNFLVVKRSDVLGAITNSSFNICVGGTHGKTTTSTMVAHLLQHSGYGCNAFLGGIASNYGSNFFASPNNVSVIEADEYDRSFLKLSPDVAIITAMDPDHLDIYGTAENVEQAFIDFSSKVKAGGCLIVKDGLKRGNEFKVQDTCTYSYSNSQANIHVQNLTINNGSYQFDVVNNYWTIKDVQLNMGGLHNVENVIAAIGVAKYLKIDDEKIKAAVSSFKGVRRRFEYIIPPSPIGEGRGEVVFIDDYAHHPDELKVLLAGAKNLFPTKKIIIAFQPHLYSRTNDFADGFAEVLSKADEIILLPIYPARELPMEGVNSEMIMARMTNKNVKIIAKEQLTDYLKNIDTTNSVLITAGAGDIDTLVEPIKNNLTK
ncbi:MAG: UDP-N-acetylmuramate--L-alanine ligase [Ferruginibacter sp.]|nr:UDP-N-acetylmuramate--L-alanine ligase [Ferruginibacter sp.]